MSTLQEALIEAGIPAKFGTPSRQKDFQQKFQIFKLPITRLEIPILIKVRCDSEDQGLDFIAGWKLNSIEAESREEAQTKINQCLSDVQFGMKGTDNGCPLYWK